MKTYRAHLIIFCLLAISLAACLPQKKITYFQDHDSTITAFAIDTSYSAVIEPNDILNIYVTSLSEDAGKYFNFSENPIDEGSLINGYLVDHNGYIQLPLIGAIKVNGLTSISTRDTIKSRLGKYLVNPAVKVSIRNFKVTILGEVAHPGVYPVTNEKITITELLALAGDLTMYGKRDNMLMIRESNGKKIFTYIDLTSREFLSSPYYILHANDIIYVEPITQKKFMTQTWWRVVPVVVGILTAIYIGINISK